MSLNLKKKVEELQDDLDHLKDNYKEYLPQIVDLTSKITLNPTDSDLYFKRSKAHHVFDDYGKAIEDFTKTIELGLEGDFIELGLSKCCK